MQGKRPGEIQLYRVVTTFANAPDRPTEEYYETEIAALIAAGMLNPLRDGSYEVVITGVGVGVVYELYRMRVQAEHGRISMNGGGSGSNYSLDWFHLGLLDEVTREQEIRRLISTFGSQGP